MQLESWGQFSLEQEDETVMHVLDRCRSLSKLFSIVILGRRAVFCSSDSPVRFEGVVGGKRSACFLEEGNVTEGHDEYAATETTLTLTWRIICRSYVTIVVLHCTLHIGILIHEIWVEISTSFPSQQATH